MHRECGAMAATLRRVSREVARLFLDGAGTAAADDGADVVSDLQPDDLN